MSTDSDLRKRTRAGAQAAEKEKAQHAENGVAERPALEESSFSPTDIVRAVVGLVLISTLGSYLATSGRSYAWGVQRPWWTQPKAVDAWWKGPILLTNDELAAYDGSDPEKPILLALNRTIYDVSASPHVYGPNGMYSALAAKDASRSYITTCFDPVDDLVPYFGGVEEVYVPLWLSKKPAKEEYDQIAEGEMREGETIEDMMGSIQKRIGKKRMRILREEAYKNATQRVQAQVKVWEDMFAKKQYPRVGKVVGVDEDDPNKFKHLKFCDAALKQRPSLADTLGIALAAITERDGGKLNIGSMAGMGMAPPGGAKPAKKKKDESQDDPSGENMREAHVEELLAGGKYAPGGEKDQERKAKAKAEKQKRVAEERAARAKKLGEHDEIPSDE